MLTGLIDQALVGNQELEILAEDIRIARSEIPARRGADLPFVALRKPACAIRGEVQPTRRRRRAAGRRGDGDRRRAGDGPRAPVDGPN